MIYIGLYFLYAFIQAILVARFNDDIHYLVEQEPYGQVFALTFFAPVVTIACASVIFGKIIKFLIGVK
jgi:hypothetical protein